jgi:hypothetical protein
MKYLIQCQTSIERSQNFSEKKTILRIYEGILREM